MAPPLTTTVVDEDDVRLDDYRRLQDPTSRRQVEEAGGFFVVEGWEPVKRLLASGWDVRSVLVTEDKVHRIGSLVERDASFPLYNVSRALAQKVTGFDVHRGLLASADRPEAGDWRRVATGAGRLAILEGINDQENLGAIFRSAAALGIDAVLLGSSVPDPLSRRSVRVSMGGVLMVPFARFDAGPRDLADLKAIGFTLVALTPDPAAIPIGTVSPASRVALLLGAEAEGLSKAALAATDLQVRIPQTGALDSLNVGHAAAIAFHHFGRR